MKVIVRNTSVKSPVRAFWLIDILEAMLPHGIRGDIAAEVLDIIAQAAKFGWKINWIKWSDRKAGTVAFTAERKGGQSIADTCSQHELPKLLRKYFTI